MKKKSFRATVLSGHKGCAVEVPFNPGEEWGLEPVPLWPGRRGYQVKATVAGQKINSQIVSRQRRFFLLVPEETMQAADVTTGQLVGVTVTV